MKGKLSILLFVFSINCYGQFGVVLPPYVGTNGWLWHCAITYDHTQVIGVDQSSFTIAVNITDATLKTVANGGDVNNTATVNSETVPTDLAFFSDAGLTTMISGWDVKMYDQVTNGQIVAHVLISTLSHSTDGTIYMAWGKSSVTTFQGGSIGSPYDANTKTVLPFGNGTTFNPKDFSSAGQNGTATSVSAATGVNDGCASYNGTSSKVTTVQSTSPFNGQTTGTLFCIVNLTSNTFAPIHFRQRDGNNTYACYTIGSYTSTGGQFTSGTAGKMYCHQANSQTIGNSTGNLSTGTSYVIAWATDASNCKFYINGSLDNTFSGNFTIPTDGSSTNDTYGYWSGGAGTQYYMSGLIEEIIVSNIKRDDNWQATMANFYKSGSTALTVGAKSH